MAVEKTYDHSLSSLRWQRLSATLLNIRSSPAMTAHPFTVFQAVIKGVSSSTGFSDEAAVFFHLRDRKHTYRLRESDRINLGKKETVKSFLNQYEAEMERKNTKNTKNTLSLKESIYVQTAIFKNYVLENKPLTFYAWNV